MEGGNVPSNYHTKMRAGYRVEMTGREVYELLAQLERRAVNETNYIEVAKCVTLAERLRGQVEAQGWGHDAQSRDRVRI